MRFKWLNCYCHQIFPQASSHPWLSRDHWSKVLLWGLLLAGEEGYPFRGSSISGLQKPVLKIVGSINWSNLFAKTTFVLNQWGTRSGNIWTHWRKPQLGGSADFWQFCHFLTSFLLCYCVLMLVTLELSKLPSWVTAGHIPHLSHLCPEAHGTEGDYWATRLGGRILQPNPSPHLVL